jgi:hypothetical protein
LKYALAILGIASADGAFFEIIFLDWGKQASRKKIKANNGNPMINFLEAKSLLPTNPILVDK